MTIMLNIRNILLYLLLFTGLGVSGQEAEQPGEPAEPVEPVMEMVFVKDTDGNINLKTSMVDYVNRQPVPLSGLKIDFYAGEDSLINLGNVTTDEDGMAVLVLHDISTLPLTEGGEVRYYAEYEGDENYLSAEYEVYIIDANLEMKLGLVDSVKTVTVWAHTLFEGEKIPVVDEDIYVYVARMFNDLPLGEGFLDENGEFMIEVPDDIPGDLEGNIEIIARFNDHYLFGTVEQRQELLWGVQTDPHVYMTKRTLWTQIAPMWMIVTLTVLLTGVWSHYLYVVIQLFRINRIAKKENQTNLV
jgi:hypothetical protein